MADSTARVHRNKSNRASAAKPADHKPVFRSVLSNPFEVQWPSVPVDLANSILAQSIELLKGVSEYHLSREAKSRKKKRERRAAAKGSRSSFESSRKKRKRLDALGEDVMTFEKPDSDAEHPPYQHIPAAVDGLAATAFETDILRQENSDVEKALHLAPPVLQHLSIGINEVTKKLEAQAKATRAVVSVSSATTAIPAITPIVPVSVVLVCRGDVDPPLLVAHLPQLVAACNSVRRSPALENSPAVHIKIIPLPKGAEVALAEALGLRRASVIAIDKNMPGIDGLNGLLTSTPTVFAPWLVYQDAELRPQIILEPTHIKQLRTSAPKDMRAAKEQRTKGKAEAKARRGAGEPRARKKVKMSVSV